MRALSLSIVLTALLAPATLLAQSRTQNAAPGKSRTATAQTAATVPVRNEAAVGSRMTPPPAAPAQATAQPLGGRASQMANPAGQASASKIAPVPGARASQMAAPRASQMTAPVPGARASQMANPNGQMSASKMAATVPGARASQMANPNGQTSASKMGVPGTRASQMAQVRGTLMAAQPGQAAPTRLPSISSANPALLIVLGDWSHSMGDAFAGYDGSNGEKPIRKADAVADVVNNLIENSVRINSIGREVKNRFDVAYVGYGNHQARNGFEGPLANQDVATLQQVADNPADVVEEQGGEGPVRRPIWTQPQTGGNTPMVAGLGHARQIVQRWNRRPAAPHLVIVVHATDGEPSDGDPVAATRELEEEIRRGGGVPLITNVHLSSTASAPIVFPSDASQLDQYGQKLFEMSSVIPPEVARAAAAQGIQVGEAGGRMMAYNAGIDQLLRLFTIGTQPAVAAQ